MSIFENIVIGKSAVVSLTITVILMIAIPVCFFICWRRKHKEQTKISWLIAGAAGFVIFARMLEVGVHYFCIVADNPVSRFINGNAAAFVLYGITMAGIFEECGRLIILKYILKKDRTRENAVIYGIGHGGIEILTVLLPAMILYLAIAVMFSQGDTEAALKTLNITEETATAALPSVQAAAAFDYAMMAMNVMERLLAMLIHIGLTIVVYYGVVNAKKLCLPAAILLHMLADTFPALYQRGILPLWAVEIWIVFWTLMIMLIAAKLYKRMSEIGH